MSPFSVMTKADYDESSLRLSHRPCMISHHVSLQEPLFLSTITPTRKTKL